MENNIFTVKWADEKERKLELIQEMHDVFTTTNTTINNIITDESGTVVGHVLSINEDTLNILSHDSYTTDTHEIVFGESTDKNVWVWIIKEIEVEEIKEIEWHATDEDIVFIEHQKYTFNSVVNKLYEDNRMKCTTDTPIGTVVGRYYLNKDSLSNAVKVKLFNKEIENPDNYFVRLDRDGVIFTDTNVCELHWILIEKEQEGSIMECCRRIDNVVIVFEEEEFSFEKSKVYAGNPIKVRACEWTGDNLEEIKKICENVKVGDDHSLVASFYDENIVICPVGNILGFDMELYKGFSMIKSIFIERYHYHNEINDEAYTEADEHGIDE